MSVEPEVLHITPARLSALSDGIIAIAATLLILDLKAPAADQPVWRTLGQQWPALDTYAVTFLVIGIAWIHHHNLFHQVRHVDRTLLFLNVGMLATISFLPLPTATLGSHLRGAGARDAAVFYALSMMASALWFTLFWNHLCRHPELVHPAAQGQARTARLKSLVGPTGYAIAALLALVSPVGSLGLCAALVAYFVIGRQAPATRTRIESPVEGDVTTPPPPSS